MGFPRSYTSPIDQQIKVHTAAAPISTATAASPSSTHAWRRHESMGNGYESNWSTQQITDIFLKKLLLTSTTINSYTHIYHPIKYWRTFTKKCPYSFVASARIYNLLQYVPSLPTGLRNVSPVSCMPDACEKVSACPCSRACICAS
jgi:hypothetical protein